VDGPAYDGKTNGQARYIDASAILGRDRLHVFVINRSPAEKAPLRIKLADGVVAALEEAEILSGPDAKAANSYENPDVIVARTFAEAKLDAEIDEAGIRLELPPLSVSAMSFTLRNVTT
jgi:alpha-L-arabinofuranosidase